MPLHDQFRPPLIDFTSWEGFHGQWPAMIVIALSRTLPRRYVAEPRVHLGSHFEIDIASYEQDNVMPSTAGTSDSGPPRIGGKLRRNMRDSSHPLIVGGQAAGIVAEVAVHPKTFFDDDVPGVRATLETRGVGAISRRLYILTFSGVRDGCGRFGSERRARHRQSLRHGKTATRCVAQR